MSRRLGVGALLSGLVLTAGVLLFGAPAGAIQTTTWGIQPSDQAAKARAGFDYPSNGQTVHDTVIVYNRTTQPQVVNLSVLSATRGRTGYQYSPERTGLAGGIQLAATRIPLGPNQQATVPFTVRLPRHSKSTAVAAISAEGSPVKEGALLVQQQLIILVKGTPSTTGPLVPDIGLWGPVAGGLLSIVAGLVALEMWKRRRKVEPADGRPGGAGVTDRNTRVPVGAGTGD